MLIASTFCRLCGENLVPCPQDNHNCQGGMLHVTDGTHECGWLNYITLGIINEETPLIASLREGMTTMSNSLWTHATCRSCWDELDINHGNLGKEPIQLRHSREICCFCGHLTTDGIFTQANGITLQCKGNHVTVEPSTGLHIVTVNGPGIMTHDYETGKPVAMWIVTLANENTAFLTLDPSVLEAIGRDLITMETLIGALVQKFGAPSQKGPKPNPFSLSATEMRASLEYRPPAPSPSVTVSGDVTVADQPTGDSRDAGAVAQADSATDGYAQ